MTKLTHIRRVRNSESSFIVKGQTRGDLHILASWCIRPVPIHKEKGSRYVPDILKNVKGHDQLYTGAELNLGVACRRCAGCLQHKRKLWGTRAYWECLHSVRTWFGTLTFTPAEHEQAIRHAMEYAWNDGVDYHKLSAPEQLALEAKVLVPFVQQFFKRLRKGAKPSTERPKGRPPAKFRYLLVFEPHESGLLHFHVLLHETSATPMLKADLEEQWGERISHWRLVPTGDKRAVWYCCKYLSKEAEYKPRASLYYGRPFQDGRTAQRSPSGEAARTNLESETTHHQGGNNESIETNENLEDGSSYS